MFGFFLSARVTDQVLYHALPPPCLQKKGKGEEADSTTEEEIRDLTWLTVKKFHAKTGHYPYLNYDNNKIQVNIGLHPDEPEKYRLSSNHGEDIVMPRNRKLPQPTHSPDCNRPVEHPFGYGKTKIRNTLYLKKPTVTEPDQLRPVVHKQFTSGMPPLAVQSDIEGIPLLWKILSTPAGVSFCDDDGELHYGSGGNWGPKPTQ